MRQKNFFQINLFNIMKIIKVIILFDLLICFLKTNLYAQQSDSLKHKYINQTITPYGNYFLKGSERLLYKDLPNEFKIS
jgi:hypothetical protein